MTIQNYWILFVSAWIITDAVKPLLSTVTQSLVAVFCNFFPVTNQCNAVTLPSHGTTSHGRDYALRMGRFQYHE